MPEEPIHQPHDQPEAKLAALSGTILLDSVAAGRDATGMGGASAGAQMVHGGGW